MPTNSAVDILLPEAANGEIAFLDAGLGLRLSEAEGVSGVEADGKVFYRAVLEDTDLLLTPTPVGVETFLQLRSGESPEVARFQFDLADRYRLAYDAPTRTVWVLEGDRQVGAVRPPVAVDAAGEPVHVSYELAGNTLSLAMPHRGKDLEYPILVDPVIDYFDSWYAGTVPTGPSNDIYGNYNGDRWYPTTSTGNGSLECPRFRGHLTAGPVGGPEGSQSAKGTCAVFAGVRA